MADKKISQLPVGEINSTSIFPIVSDGITSRVSFDDMADAFGGGGGSQDFDQVLGEGNITAKEFYNELILEGGVKMLAGVFTGNTNDQSPVNGIRLDLDVIEPGLFVQMGFGIGEGPFIQVDYNEGGETETIRKYFYFDFQTETDNNGQRILTDKDLQKIYKGVFNQEGTNEPVIQEFYNNTNFSTFNFYRSDVGVYAIQVSGNYLAYINVGQNVLDAESRVHAYTSYEPKSNETSFYIYTYSEGVLSDNVVTNMFFEIGLKEIVNP